MEFPAWDPVLLDLPGPIDLRWYGLMYVVGFVAAQWILIRLARVGLFPVPPSRAPDLILYAVVGVMLGGRTGYALFYEQELLAPSEFVQVWKGGLSFHGGLAGVTLALLWFGWRHKVPWLRIGDAAALAVTPGILAVRIANFINGELYGRVTGPGVGWAMRFPTDPVARQQMHISGQWPMRDQELLIQYAYRHRSWESVREDLTQGVDWEAVRPFLDWEAVRDEVPYRHPSQLYEGLCEGLVLGLVLLGVFLLTRRRPLRDGYYGALFLLGYAGARFSLEFVRQPDAQFGPEGTVLLGMTMGQTLSTAMVVGALLILLLSRRRTPLAPAAEPAQRAAPEDAPP